MRARRRSKKAYKRAALKYHPDKAEAADRPEAENRFKLLVEANEVLTNQEKRARYDAGWSNEEIAQGFQEGQGMGGGGGMGGMGGMPEGMEEMLFAAMFQQQQQARRGGGRGRGGFM